jgi:HlyD family secretion protein/hemolysin D
MASGSLRPISGGALAAPNAKLSRIDRQFLAPALEIAETPPSPLGRAITYAIIAIAISGLCWAVIGHVDIVAVASGKIVTQARTKVVEPFETASVKSILVRPGEHVRRGQPLIELEQVTAQAEEGKARQDLVAASLDSVRLRAFVTGAGKLDPSETYGASALQLAEAEARLLSQKAEAEAKLAGLRRDRDEKAAERETLLRTLAKQKSILPIVTERAEIRQKSADTAFGSRFLNLEAQQQLLETKAEVGLTESKIVSAEAAILSIGERIAATDAETHRTALADLAKAQEQMRSAQEALTKAIRKIELSTLRAPIDGTVQQLNVTTVGGIVTPAQQLVSIVPEDESVEIEVALENRDIGFVKAGQAAEIKIEAYPFTRFGLAKGVVSGVDRDAEPVTPASAKSGSKRPSDSTEYLAESERLLYSVRIKLVKGLPAHGEDPLNLLPGMAVKAEILTGRRRIIDYLLSPLSEYRHDGLRER